MSDAKNQLQQKESEVKSLEFDNRILKKGVRSLIDKFTNVKQEAQSQTLRATQREEELINEN